MRARTPIEETEQRLLPAPSRGILVAAGLTAAAGVLVAVAAVTGWLGGHAAAHAHHAAKAAPSPVQLLWRLVLAVIVIVILAKLFGGLARRLGQPAVLGEIAAGLVLGPTLIFRLAPGLFHAIIPVSVLPNLSLLAQAGLVIFMFAVGMEVDRDMLRQHGRVIAAASQSMMIVPFAIGIAAAIPLYSTFHGHHGLVPYALFVGTAISVTAFPVLARIVQDCGLRGTRLGSLAMLCAAVCDVLAWCALAVVLAMTKSQGALGVLRTLGLTLALAVVALLVLRPLLKLLAGRFADRPAPDSLRLILVVALIFGLGAATDKIGVHDIFGGFLAGLVVPRDTALLQPVTDRLDRLNRALLLPVFFVSIGLQVNAWQAVVNPAVLGGGALLLVVAVVAKFGGTALVAGAGGMPPRHALGLGALMNARGVTDIVVISTGLTIGVINASAFTVLVMMALITTMMAEPSLRLLGLYRPGSVARLGEAVPAEPVALPEN